MLQFFSGKKMWMLCFYNCYEGRIKAVQGRRIKNTKLLYAKWQIKRQSYYIIYTLFLHCLTMNTCISYILYEQARVSMCNLPIVSSTPKQLHLQFWLHMLTYGPLKLHCVAFDMQLRLGVRLNLKQRQRQDTDGFRCDLHLLTLRFINKHWSDNAVDINSEEKPYNN